MSGGGIITGDKTVNRKVLSVLSVLSSFFRERDEKRFKKYFEDRPSTGEKTTQTKIDKGPKSKTKTTKTPQRDRVMEVKEYVEKVIASGLEGVTYTALTDAGRFSETLISHLIQSGQLFKIPGTELYRWGG